MSIISCFHLTGLPSNFCCRRCSSPSTPFIFSCISKPERLIPKIRDLRATVETHGMRLLLEIIVTGVFRISVRFDVSTKYYHSPLLLMALRTFSGVGSSLKSLYNNNNRILSTKINLCDLR